MGAYYDIIVSPAGGAIDHVRRFLATRNLSCHQSSALLDTPIPDEAAILISGPENGWVQVLARCAPLMISATEWYHYNPLARYLSTHLGDSVHLWSLDSGFAVGYTLFSAGEKRECQTLFSRHAGGDSELPVGIPVPEEKRGHALGHLLGDMTYNFSESIRKYSSLEIGLSELVARFGFAVHLVDYYDAVDDKQGISVDDGQYCVVELSEWNAVIFESAPVDARPNHES